VPQSSRHHGLPIHAKKLLQSCPRIAATEAVGVERGTAAPGRDRSSDQIGHCGQVITGDDDWPLRVAQVARDPGFAVTHAARLANRRSGLRLGQPVPAQLGKARHAPHIGRDAGLLARHFAAASPRVFGSVNLHRIVAAAAQPVDILVRQRNSEPE
jgi:hypothetical protein